MEGRLVAAPAARTRALGATATLFALGGIAVAILLDPTFSWTGDALSDLGVRDRSALAFNWGLLFGGVTGVGYAVGLGRTSIPRGSSVSDCHRGSAVLRDALLALAMVAMAGVGAFDLTEPLHGPAAVGFYALVTLVFAADGFTRRSTTSGRVTLAFVPVHVAVWTTFLAGWWPVSGLALPELPGALMLAAWVWLLGPLPVIGGRGALANGVGEP
ncbi:MAG: DUF998 domain-containing protein [Halorubrum sp.]